jgi:hypothetical protein
MRRRFEAAEVHNLQMDGIADDSVFQNQRIAEGIFLAPRHRSVVARAACSDAGSDCSKHSRRQGGASKR